MTEIIKKIQCRLCEDIIEYKYRHGFVWCIVWCKCGEIFTDGGTEYFSRGAKDMNNIINLS